jgi:hypothetical protein
VLDGQSLSIQKANLPGVSAWALTANGARVHVGGSTGEGAAQGVVVSVDPATLQEVRRQVVDQSVAFITDDERNVVAVGKNGRIYVFSAGGLELQRTIDMPGISFTSDSGPRSVMIQGDNLLVANGQQFGENGAILVLSGWRPAAMPVQPAPPPANPAAMPVAPPQPPSNSTAGATDCPDRVASGGDSTGIWRYEDPDMSATKVEAIPSESTGLVADRCLTTWCHVSFRGKNGWVQRKSIQAVCN